MKSFWTKHKTEAIIFFVAVVVRVAYALMLQGMFGSDVFTSYSDANEYRIIAGNIAQHGVFSEATVAPQLVLDAMRTPGYPAWLALFQWFKLPYFVAICVQDILAGIVAVLIYRLALLLFNNRRAGIGAAIIFAFDPAAIYWANLLMSDHFAGVFFITATWLLAKKKYGWAGVVYGITTLIRPVFFYLFPLVIVMIVWLHRNTIRESLKNKTVLASMRPIIVMTLFFFLVIFPWMIRNKVHFNTWALSSNGWVAIHYFTTVPFAVAHHELYAWPKPPTTYYPIPDSAVTEGPGRDILYSYEFSNHPFYKDAWFTLFQKYPLDYLRFHFGSAFRSFFNADYDYLVRYVLLAKVPAFPLFFTKIFTLFFYTLWYGLCVLSLWTLFKKDYRVWGLFLLAFPICNAIITGPVGDGSSRGRYNLPFFPFYVLLGVVAALDVYDRFKSNRPNVILNPRRRG